MVKVFLVSASWKEKFWPSVVGTTKQQVLLPEMWNSFRSIRLLYLLLLLPVSAIRVIYLVGIVPVKEKVVLVDHKSGIGLELRLVKEILMFLRADLIVTIDKLPTSTTPVTGLEL